jgi:hypothetical protein
MVSQLAGSSLFPIYLAMRHTKWTIKEQAKAELKYQAEQAAPLHGVQIGSRNHRVSYQFASEFTPPSGVTVATKWRQGEGHRIDASSRPRHTSLWPHVS